MRTRSSVLASFSGKNGDILWSLPTVRALAAQHLEPIDFCIMPQYEKLLPLLNMQPYINQAFVVDDWLCSGSPCGDQPWQHPERLNEGYLYSYPLTYKYHPALFLAHHTMVNARAPLPNVEGVYKDFIFVDSKAWIMKETEPFDKIIPYAFNEMMGHSKEAYRDGLMIRAASQGYSFCDLGQFNWVDAALYIKACGRVLTDRSAIHVLAHGLGCKRVGIAEPIAARNTVTFVWPYGDEHTVYDFSEESTMSMLNYLIN